MGGVTVTCPICGVTARVRSEEWMNSQFEDSPFEANRENKLICKKCKLPAVATWSLREYVQITYNSLLKFESGKLNECIHKGYFAEAIIMLHVQLTSQLSILILRSIPTDNTKAKVIEEFFKRGEAYSLINLAFIYDHINKVDFDTLIRLNKLRNKFAHSFEDRKKVGFSEIREIIDSAKISCSKKYVRDKVLVFILGGEDD